MPPAQRAHLIESGESLASIALVHGLPGWQSSYFWEGNLDFRARCPDPWHPEAGSRFVIPELTVHADGLRRALAARLRLLGQARSEARQLLQRQGEMLRNPAAESSFFKASSASADAGARSPTRSYRLTAILVETTLEAIQLLKADDRGMSRASWALAKDAAARRPPVDSASSAELLTLLGRAAEAVAWGIPDHVARPWCDARDPAFWGKRLWAALPNTSDAVRLAAMLDIASQQTGDAVVRMLDNLHVEALEEARRLERILQSIQVGPS